MEAALQGELEEAGANLDNVIKVMSYRTISEGPRRYWARVRVCVCVVIRANASPESSCTEMQWTLGTQPLKTCVTGPLEGKHQSGGAGTQSQQLVLRPNGSRRDQSGHAEKPERLPTRTSRVRRWEDSISEEAPLLWGSRACRPKHQTDGGGRKRRSGGPPPDTWAAMGRHGPALRRSGLTALWRDTPRGHTITRDRWTERTMPGSYDRGKTKKAGHKN